MTVEGEESRNEDVTSSADENGEQSNVPIILPRMRYTGARNVSTIKDGTYY
jgi:ethanolamine utilization microcompartment shell protein EutL